MKIIFSTLTSLLLSGTFCTASAQAMRVDQVVFRSLYKELVETNTTDSVGSCTAAAAKVGRRMKAAGFGNVQLTFFSVPRYSKNGGLVAVLPGSDPNAGAILLLAHLDVVEAHRADWTRDPFKLIEENGNFYGRGSSDDKAQAAIWADAMINFKKSGYQARRTIKMALTCGEEDGAFNGVKWLVNNRRALIDAEFALNEGGGGELDADGKPQYLAMNVGEKTYQDFDLVLTNSGGHSSRPVRPNAIYQLASALQRIAEYTFPVHLNDTTRAMLTQLSTQTSDPAGTAFKELVAHPDDNAAAELVAQDPAMNATIRTTCVATMVEAGHARNALPQRAHANVNCRIIPGETIEQVKEVLTRVVADPEVKIGYADKKGTAAGVVPLRPAIVDPAVALGKKMFPGVPMLTTISAGATDGRYLGSVGIPTYGIPGIFDDPDYGHVHGLNERIRVKSLYEGRDYMVELVRLYAQQK